MDMWNSLTAQFGTPAVLIGIGLFALLIYSIFFSGKGGKGSGKGSSGSKPSSGSTPPPPPPPPASPGA